MVYEFDSADMLTGYMYPAMVRAFRSGGVQFAAMFAYDMLATASRNLGWQTHYLNLVYTPPAERGRGYGAAVSAGVTRRALADGADTCMLYADVANDTSNGIYRRIGYRAFASSVVLRFA